MKALLTVLLGLFLAIPASAQMRTGNDLYYGDAGGSDYQAIRNRSLYFVMGFLDTSTSLSTLDGAILPFCMPDGVSYGQVDDLFQKTLRSYPELRHMAASLLIRQAMAKAWPCK